MIRSDAYFFAFVENNRQPEWNSYLVWLAFCVCVPWFDVVMTSPIVGLYIISTTILLTRIYMLPSLFYP
jgi:hypothetical protein